MSEPTNIGPTGHLNGDGGKLSEDQLMRYLEGRLSAAEQHEVEEWLAGEGMESDALEGLKSIHPEETRHAVTRLNTHLRQSLHHKRHHRRKRGSDYYTLIALCVILMLAIIAYIVIRRAI